jgi:hypothetical protein
MVLKFSAALRENKKTPGRSFLPGGGSVAVRSEDTNETEIKFILLN